MIHVFYKATEAFSAALLTFISEALPELPLKFLYLSITLKPSMFSYRVPQNSSMLYPLSNSKATSIVLSSYNSSSPLSSTEICISFLGLLWQMTTTRWLKRELYSLTLLEVRTSESGCQKTMSPLKFWIELYPAFS